MVTRSSSWLVIGIDRLNNRALRTCTSAVLLAVFKLGLVNFVFSAGHSPALWTTVIAAPAHIARPITTILPSAYAPSVELTGALPVTSTLYFPMIYTPPPPIYLAFVARPEPLLPVNPYPPHQAQGQSANAFLAWETVAPPGDGVRFDLYLEANNAQPTQRIGENLTRRNYDLPTFLPDTQYYWRVVAISEHGQRVEGPVWTFRVESLLDPPAIGAMIKIPAGEFMMGCNQRVDQCVADTHHRETPLHAVYLDAYEIGKYEVTNVEYRACVEAGVCGLPRKLRSHRREFYFENPEYDHYPVVFVSWWDAQTFCQWDGGKRLPTEAEWEKAARGPIDTRAWPWGNEGPDCSRGNYRLTCGRDTVKVGSFPTGASPYGLMDVTGNVFEWVADKYDAAYYSYSPYLNPQGPEVSRTDLRFPFDPPPKVYFGVRGGSYRDNWWYGRTAFRHWGHHGDRPGEDEPYYRNSRVGFRCARSITE